MEKITHLISGLLDKQKSLYETLHDIALQDREHIVNMDVTALWQTTDRKKQLARDIQETTEMLFQSFRSGKGKVRPDNIKKTGNLTGGIEMLDVPLMEKAELRQRIQGIQRIKEDVALRSSENKRYLTDYLSVIDGIFSTLMPRKDNGRYSAAGKVDPAKNSQYLIQAEV